MIDLSGISVFSTLSSADLKEITPSLISTSARKKEVIFSEGDPSEWFYIVAEGKVKITKLSQDGKEIILEVIHPMDFFGGLAVIRGFPYPANAVAMEDTKLLKISRSNLMRVLDRFPSLMYCIAQQVGDRMKESHETLKNIALERVEARIASLLLKLSDKTGKKADEGIVIDMKLTKQDIAEMVGTTVETSIRTMSKLRKMGIVGEKEGKILIKNLEKLKALCY
ncbi:MAG TPA: Crp/Fnr family transcriptional regulator [Thermodesulfovibrionales bacterium]|nr:Crp/Fnr family transcriptional regulator [Thermodesulfovibrionales bacterium]